MNNLKEYILEKFKISKDIKFEGQIEKIKEAVEKYFDDNFSEEIYSKIYFVDSNFNNTNKIENVIYISVVCYKDVTDNIANDLFDIINKIYPLGDYEISINHTKIINFYPKD